MKLATSLSSRFSPKRIFKSKSKSKSSITRSDNNPSSFSSTTSSSSSEESYNLKQSSTPISVLPSSDFYTELIQSFKLIDTDHDGIVSRTDLTNLLTKLSPEPPSQEEVSLMLNEIDNCISVEELASRVAESEGFGSEEMKEVFEYFDVDRDGRISAEELFRVFGVIGGGDERCTLDECRRMIATVDNNGDGFVCFDDFSRMMSLNQ